MVALSAGKGRHSRNFRELRPFQLSTNQVRNGTSGERARTLTAM
jgi:hypothetical protein